MNDIANQGFVACDRFNVYELTSKSDDIHGKENNALDARRHGSSVRKRATSVQLRPVETLLGNVWRRPGALDCYSV